MFGFHKPHTYFTFKMKAGCLIQIIQSNYTAKQNQHVALYGITKAILLELDMAT